MFTSDALVFRPVTADDIDELQQLSRSTFETAFAHLNKPEDIEAYLDKAFSRDQLLSEVTNKESIWYFLTYENKAIAYLKLNKGNAQQELKESHSMELERIYVAAGFQGKGLGHILIDKAIDEARKAKVDFLWLGVWEKNLRAKKLYEEKGFVEFSSHQFLLGSDIQTDILMRLDLERCLVAYWY